MFDDKVTIFLVERVEQETAKAVLFWIGGKTVWVPRSVIPWTSEIRDRASWSPEGWLSLPTWWAKKAGLV